MTRGKTIILIVLAAVIAYSATLGINYANTNIVIGIVSAPIFCLAVAFGVTGTLSLLRWNSK